MSLASICQMPAVSPFYTAVVTSNLSTHCQMISARQEGKITLIGYHCPKGSIFSLSWAGSFPFLGGSMVYPTHSRSHSKKTTQEREAYKLINIKKNENSIFSL